MSWVDWTRQRCFVEADDRGGRARWSTGGLGGASFALARSLVVRGGGADLCWWTWAGFRTNATLASTLSEQVDGTQRVNDVSIRIRGDVTRELWTSGTAGTVERLCLPEIDARALDGLKFAEALPRRLAVATLAARLADLDGAATVLGEPVRFGHTPE